MKFFWSIFRILIATTVFAAISLVAVDSTSSATTGVTATFVANDGSLPISYAAQVAQTDAPTPLTLFITLFPSLDYVGHTFDYWSTQPGGGGTEYLDGANYPFSNDTTFYAQWIGPTHTVTFYQNSSPQDSIESYQVAHSPSPLNLFVSLSTLFFNPNYLFKDWTTGADGSGVVYADGEYFRFQTSQSLFAQWTPKRETLTFSSNSGEGGIPSAIADFGSSLALPALSPFSRSGYTPTGWNTMPDGGGHQYEAGALIKVTADETLYAQWSRDTYAVAFEIPGLLGQIAPISVLAGDAIILRSSSELVNPGYSFAGWFGTCQVE